ncbi:CIA30 family protein [Winogradskyella litoriviva]|uniref:CIA30 family protein n=1 Tax=Winogradskyella litoriviva TaxID=1220182 RepID=A0ABX2E3E7_9FLAO|nr:CIA30 family protein [Winogradskyella litoriviva]NRD22794.1 CIA30 family protein [Winogradskyella litoriviva]
MTIFNFNSDSNISNWKIVDDVVMGGRSNGEFKLSNEGYGEFSGKISLENNGGFSSVRYAFETLNSSGYSKFIIRIKGDGKMFQFRVKANSNSRHSYIYKFNTTRDWQTIEIPFKEMSPSFRGYALDIPNYNGEQMENITFLIGNKKEESFMLLIDSIILK